jgi:hypothetical protein
MRWGNYIKIAAEMMGRFVIALAASLSLTACASPTQPAPASNSKTSVPILSIVSMSVTADTLSTGARAYRATVKLRESGGAAATVAAIDLTFMSGSSAIVSSHADKPISDAGNVCAANSTVDSRELMTMDDNPAHPAATSVVAKVTFTDGGSMTSTATGSAEVMVPNPPATFTLSGLVSDDAGSKAIAGVAIQILDGANAGKGTSTDGTGNYSLAGLAGGSFTVRASVNAYDATERAVTVAGNTRLDLRLRPVQTAPPPPPPPSGPCSYTLSPSSTSTDFKGGGFSATISNTAGNCSWEASSDVSWITFPSAKSGTGNATLSYIVLVNGGVVASNTRFGTVTITWTGGSAQLRVQQGGASQLCEFTVSTGSQDLGNVPSAGGQYTATITWIDTGLPPGVCGLTASSDPWITLPSTSIPQVNSFTFTVSANPSPGSSRSGSVSLRSRDRSATIGVTQR